MSRARVSPNTIFDRLAMAGTGVRYERMPRGTSGYRVSLGDVTLCLATGPTPHRAATVHLWTGGPPDFAGVLLAVAELVPVVRDYRGVPVRLMVGPAGGFGDEDLYGHVAEDRDPDEVVGLVRVLVGVPPNAINMDPRPELWADFYPAGGPQAIAAAVLGDDPRPLLREVAAADPDFGPALRLAMQRRSGDVGLPI